MPLVWVDDPNWKGKPPIPKTLRSYAMRTLFKQGMTVSQIAEFYGVSYHLAYKGINPPRKTRGVSPVLNAAKVASMPRSALLKIVTKRGAKANDRKVLAAAAELDRRNPKWVDEWL